MAEQTPAVNPCGGSPGGGGGGGGGGNGAQDAGLGGMLFPIAIFVLIFYFMILRPQNKRKKQQDALIGGITRGDQIITYGGVFGTVREVRDDSFMIEIAEGVKVRMLKNAISTKTTSTPLSSQDKKD